MKTTVILLAFGTNVFAAPSLPTSLRRDTCKTLSEGEEVFTSCITNIDLNDASFGSVCIVNGNKCVVDGGPTFTNICVTNDNACALFRKKRGFKKLPPGVDNGDDCQDEEFRAEFPEECQGGFPGPNFGGRKKRGFKKLPPGVDNGDDCEDEEFRAEFPEDCQGGFPGPNLLGEARGWCD